MIFSELVNRRHSVRNFSAKAIEEEKILYIKECVRLAPSAVNFQPWTFLWIENPDKLHELQKTYNRSWFATAPAVVVACANHEESWKRPCDGKDHSDIDVAIAVEHLCLSAAEQGLGTCWVCNFDAALCHEMLNLPPNVEPVALIPIGYPVDETIPEKKRKSLNDIFPEAYN